MMQNECPLSRQKAALGEDRIGTPNVEKKRKHSQLWCDCRRYTFSWGQVVHPVEVQGCRTGLATEFVRSLRYPALVLSATAANAEGGASLGTNHMGIG